jgi:protein involved in polysaccharide export with SLBB domain
MYVLSLFFQNSRSTEGAARAGIFLAALVLLSYRSPAMLQAQTPPADPVTATSTARFRREYVFAPGDQIEVLVRKVPEASRTVMIRPDGQISLPMLDEVPVAGLTTSELNAKLAQLLSVRLVNPEVHVIALATRPPAVYVMGEVNAPSSIPFRDAPTAMQAISRAGGFRRSAATHSIEIIRLLEDGHLQAKPVTVEAHGQAGPMLALGSTMLEPEDMVFVPENGRSQFSRFVEDFINRPLAGVTSVVAAYLNFKLITIVN